MKKQIIPTPKLHKRNSHRYLHAIEQTGKYVFHGSPHEGIEILEPKQAHTVKENQSIPDGEPGISCTQFADIAIFGDVAKM